MSVVTNVILSFSSMEDEMSRIQDVNVYEHFGRSIRLVSADYSPGKKWYGGSKNLETPLFVGAYNKLEVSDFLMHLQRIDWVERKHVQLMVKREGEHQFDVLYLKNNSYL